jgi:hypothetical protein
MHHVRGAMDDGKTNLVDFNHQTSRSSDTATVLAWRLSRSLLALGSSTRLRDDQITKVEWLDSFGYMVMKFESDLNFVASNPRLMATAHT